ncbi:MAG: 30S ribosomal protein S4 [Nitrososphaeria archaeon]|jgi:small subunit ribosomal protein S4
MGDPKKPKKKFTSPKRPWDSERLQREMYLLGNYGLRNKRELWRAETMLSGIRAQARGLLAAPPDVRSRQEPALLGRLVGMGLLKEGATLDDVLSLKVEDLLERRLQTVIWRKNLSRTIHQSRQLIIHGHVSVGGRIVDRPGYLVPRDREQSISVEAVGPSATSPDEVSA